MILYVSLLFGFLHSATAGISDVPIDVVVDTKQGNSNNEFIPMLQLFLQLLSEKESSVTKLETKMENFQTETGNNISSVAATTNLLTHRFHLIQDHVVPSIKTYLGSFQRQISFVHQSLISLRRVAITDVKFGPVQRSAVWRGPGYNDQLGYVITQILNTNRDEHPDTTGRRKLFKMVDGKWSDVGA